MAKKRVNLADVNAELSALEWTKPALKREEGVPNQMASLARFLMHGPEMTDCPDRHTRVDEDRRVTVGPMSARRGTFLVQMHNGARHCAIELDRRQMEDIRRHISDLLSGQMTHNRIHCLNCRETFREDRRCTNCGLIGCLRCHGCCEAHVPEI